jgi:DNA primase
VDIVQLIGQSVALKRRGGRFVGLCPFHAERTPSFSVNPGKQVFYCFGCKASGTAIDFVMRRDRVEFLDALRTLADWAGVELPRSGRSREQTSQRQAVLDANSAAAAFYTKRLSHPTDGAPARAYLQQRQISEESATRFGIGVAPDAWDGLLTALSPKYPASLLNESGLVKARERGPGYYDTFRNRLMFPIRDDAGRVIALGGRVLPGSDDPAKYLNSPETPIFSKSKCVFGLDLARQRIVETRSVTVVEGYTDVVMAHQFGVTNVVSVLGTALTEQHVSILRRFADRIVLLFDADAAGDNAVNRAVELFLTQPVDIAIASMPKDTDPDEFLLAQGAEAFEKLLTSAPSVVQFMVRQFKRRWSAAGSSAVAQDEARRQFIGPFAAARSARAIDMSRWGMVVTALSKETGIPEAVLHREYGTERPRGGGRRVAAAHGAAPGEPKNTAPPAEPTAQDLAERWILGCLLLEPTRWDTARQFVSPQEFTEEVRRRLADAYWDHQRDEGPPVFNEFLASISADAELVELAVVLLDETEKLSEQLGQIDQTIATALRHFEELRRRQERQGLEAKIRQSGDQEGQRLDEQDEVALLKKLQETARRPDLRRVGS